MTKEAEQISNFFGITAALLFITGNAYYPAKLAAKNFRPWSPETALFFKRYLKVHIMLNLAALMAVTVHGHYAEERNVLLSGCFVATVWLTIAGALMHYRVVPGMQRQLRLLHTQQVLFVVWIVLIVAGHASL